MIVWINNKFVKEKEAKVSIFDQGFLFGFGVFETLLAKENKIEFLDEHMSRLFSSAKQIDLKIPYSKPKLKDSVLKSFKKSKFSNAIIKIIVSGGSELKLTKTAKPTVIVIVKKFTPYPSKYYTNGISLITVSAERNFPSVKSLGYLVNAFYIRKAKSKKAYECLFVNSKGFVTEGATSNFFVVKNNSLLTPKKNILSGITREKVIALAKKLRIKVVQKDLKKSDIYKADELFITSSTRKIMPAVKVDAKKIGNGKQGKITRKLMDFFN